MPALLGVGFARACCFVSEEVVLNYHPRRMRFPPLLRSTHEPAERAAVRDSLVSLRTQRAFFFCSSSICPFVWSYLISVAESPVGAGGACVNEPTSRWPSRLLLALVARA